MTRRIAVLFRIFCLGVLPVAVPVAALLFAAGRVPAADLPATATADR
jgi:hypothetical protein